MKSKLDLRARIISIISSIFTIIFVCSKWLEFESLPYQLYKADESGYTLFDISDFFALLHRYSGEGYGDLSNFFYAGAVAVIIASIIFIFLMLIGKRAGKVYRVIAFITSAVIFVGFFILMMVINDDVKELTYGRVDKIAEAGISPYLMMLSTIITCIFSAKEKNTETTVSASGRQCTSCGALLIDGAKFCSSCGAESDTENQNIGNKYCNNCGKEIAIDSVFCDSCGNKQ